VTPSSTVPAATLPAAADPLSMTPEIASDPTPTQSAPPPVIGKSVAAAATAGTVVVRTPDGKSVPLSSASALPTGTRVDTRNGEVALTSALDAQGHTQTGRFSGGVFEVRQPKGGKGLTQIVMVGGHWGKCALSDYTATPDVVTRAAKEAKKKKARKPIRTLWGTDDKGRFETRGGGSVATVRGTHWLTTDTCQGTRTTVLQGAVEVTSRKTGVKHLVTAGHTIFIHR
jgi:hypothetical protein